MIDSLETLKEEFAKSQARSDARRGQKARKPWWWWLSLVIVIVALAVPVAALLYLFGVIQP